MLEKKKRQMFLFHLRYFYSTYSYVILKKQKDRELKTKKTTQNDIYFCKEYNNIQLYYLVYTVHIYCIM